MRTRSIKPGFFDNETLGSADPLVQLLFAGLWCVADHDGRMEDRPARLKSKIFPYRNCDMEKLLGKLAELRDSDGMPLIIRYVASSKRVIAITKFATHQRPHPKEPSLGLPDPPPETFAALPETFAASCAYSSSSLLSHSSYSSNDCSEPHGAASEPAETALLSFPVVKKGKDPAEWPLFQSKVDEYSQSFPGVDILAECRKALQWCRDNPTKRKTFGGMAGFLTRWLSKAQDRGGSKAIPRVASGGAPSMADRIREQAERFKR